MPSSTAAKFTQSLFGGLSAGVDIGTDAARYQYYYGRRGNLDQEKVAKEEAIKNEESILKNLKEVYPSRHPQIIAQAKKMNRFYPGFSL
ncbi:hypothetical protein LCGC14_3010690 [marine sediment metagenome]|uniref:Uncharacterized protein n=1 Tax=marine sediment metagenome TaxID=412755 RepID=A0A0F8WY62_9ZZZZ